MQGVNANNVAFLSLLFFASILGLLIFVIARRERSSIGQAMGIFILAIVVALGVFLLSGSN